MAKILWIKTELLHPVDKGGRIRTFQMLRSLRRCHDVTFLALDDGLAAPDAPARAKEYATTLVTVPFRPAVKMSVRFFLELARNLFSELPYAVSRYRSAELQREIARIAPQVDVVVCDFLAPSLNVPATLPVPTVLFQHNVEAMIWERHASVPQNFVRRMLVRQQSRRMRRFEAAECRRFGHVVAVSEPDARVIRNDYGARSVSEVATGVDTDYFVPPAERPTDSREIVFVGSMDWMPNDEGVRWFIAEVLGLVRAEMPAVQLTVVGRSPTKALRDLAERVAGVVVTGSVADVRPYLARAALSIVPLRVGGGTRLKIYEAMAMALPVVATTIGAEGLPVRHDEHLVIADRPAAQAEAILALLREPARAKRLAENALAYVRTHCSWGAVADSFLAQCISPPARAARVP